MQDDTPVTTRRADRGYAICFSGRSGSNLLCQYLSSTGLLGHPLEYFNSPARRSLGYPDFPDDPEKQIDCVQTVGATENGIFGVKVSAAQFDVVGKSIDWMRMLPNLAFVLMKRRDLLGQAMSNLRATQTSQWRSTTPPQGFPAYDGNRIQENLRAAVREYARWDIFFARNGIEPTVIWYEQMVGDAQAAVDKVAARFGLKGQALIRDEKIDLKMQRDAITEEWRDRFYREFRNMDQLDSI